MKVHMVYVNVQYILYNIIVNSEPTLLLLNEIYNIQ